MKRRGHISIGGGGGEGERSGGPKSRVRSQKQREKELQVPRSPACWFRRPLCLPSGDFCWWPGSEGPQNALTGTQQEETRGQGKRFVLLFPGPDTGSLSCHRLEIRDAGVCPWLPEFKLHHQRGNFPKEINLRGEGSLATDFKWQ